MKQALLVIGGALLLSAACSPRSAQRTSDATAPRIQGSAEEAASHYLNEWFPLGAGRCRLLAAERALTEPRFVEHGRVARDVFVVDARFACANEAGEAVTARRAFAHAKAVYWRDERRDEHAPSLRTALSEQVGEEHLLFEVEASGEGLVQPRRYDVQSGDPLGARERREARLVIELAERRIVVAPWPRAHDRALDLLLDRLARTLATRALFETLSQTAEGQVAIATAAELYAQVVQRGSARQLLVRELDFGRSLPRVTLALDESSSHVSEAPLVSLTFELGGGQAQPHVARLLNAEQARRELECSEARDELESRALAARKAQPEAELCNALSTLVPGPCERANPALIATALEVGTHCREHGSAQQPTQDAPGPPPPDFTIRLRRGRARSNLDPTPRYALSLDHAGRVAFQGEHWVRSQARREGRTSARLVAELHQTVARLRFLERPWESDGKRCRARADRGDLLFVRAHGRERSVRDTDGCRGPFTSEELERLRHTLERVSAVETWTAPAGNVRERDPDIWIVAAE